LLRSWRALALALCPGQVVVMDNLGAHKGERVRKLLEVRGGCELLFLAPYSPDFSPVEEAFWKVKARLRREKARTKEALVGMIGRALDAVTKRDVKGWFGHCGYPLRGQLP
jgi:transposase